jgi:hypothetical protein
MFWVLASVWFAASGPGQACQPDTLAAVVNDHAPAAPYVLVTAGGRRLRAYGQDFVDPSAWHARDALTVCAGPDAGSLRVRDLRRGEELVTASDRATAAAPPLQIMNGPGFRALLTDVAARCPSSRVRYATPAALLGAEETFEAGLDSAALRRLHAAEHRTPAGDFPACAGRDGASCPANEAMAALERARLMRRFAESVCAHGNAPWS